jgi:isopentenyl phosphate kinase
MLVFLKLGGSLITDKTRPYTPRLDVIERLAGETRESLLASSDQRLVVGHGSGSFGHWAAKPYGTRQGVRTAAEWRGFAEVAAAAARLNRIVVDVFLRAGVPVFGLQPCASALCKDGEIVALNTRPIEQALAHGLVPLVYGDVAVDAQKGGTIISTEDIFTYLAAQLKPDRILLLGEVPGVLDVDGKLIPRIAPDTLSSLQGALFGSRGVDVTGGMSDKVNRMIQLVQRHPATDVWILTGAQPGILADALTQEGALRSGTHITARPR